MPKKSKWKVKWQGVIEELDKERAELAEKITTLQERAVYLRELTNRLRKEEDIDEATQ